VSGNVDVSNQSVHADEHDALPGTPGLVAAVPIVVGHPIGTAACHGAELSGFAVPALIADGFHGPGRGI